MILNGFLVDLENFFILKAICKIALSNLNLLTILYYTCYEHNFIM